MNIRRFSALGIGLLLLSACSAQPTTGHHPQDVPDPVVLWSMAVPRPELSAAAKEKTQDGAQEFVQYWFNLKQWSKWTRSASSYKKTFDAACEWCDNNATDVEELIEAGNYYGGGREWIVSFDKLDEAEDGSTYTFDIGIERDRTQILKGAAKILRSYEPTLDDTDTITVYWKNDEWRVRNWEESEKDKEKEEE